MPDRMKIVGAKRIFPVLAASILLMFYGAVAMAAITPLTPGVELYEHNNYTGTKLTLLGSSSNVGGSFNDRATSVKVTGNVKVTLYEHTSYGGRSLTLNPGQEVPDLGFGIYNFNDIVTAVKFDPLPVPLANTTSLNFGNLYRSDREGAANYNKRPEQARQFNLTNIGAASSTTLQWEITPPTYATVSPTSGTLATNASQTITVSFNWPSVGAATGPFVVSVNSGFLPVFLLNATVFDTPPAVSLVAPALGSNSKVNVAINDSVKFTLSASANPLFPGATIRGYQWQVVSGAATGPGANWTEVNLPEYTAPASSFPTASDYKVYARMIDSNGVSAPYVEIPVKAWNRPTVGDTPPVANIPANAGEINLATKASWLANQYVGVVGQPVKLVADGRTDAGNADITERIARYQWNAGTQGIVEQLLVNITSFNGTSSYIDLPLDVSETAYTLALRFKTTNGNAGIFSVDDGLRGSNGHDRHLFLSGGNLNARVFNNERITTSGANYADNQWHHVVHVYGGTVGGQRLYVDGVLRASGTLNRSDFDWQTGVNIGFSNDATSPYFSGNIDGVAIWSRALTEAEIQQVRNVSPLVPYTTATPNLAGSITVKSVNNYGIQSGDKRFNMKVYDTVVANPSGPYNGRPTKPVTLKGSINTNSYPTATFAYQWSVQQASGGALTNVTTAGDGSASYTWTNDGTYNAQFAATVTTVEGLQITGSSGFTTVKVESGRPTALPGGPYRGGIAGGNFTPIPFEGNPPGFVEATDIGTIQQWVWFWPYQMPGVLQFNGDDYVEVANNPSVDLRRTITLMIRFKVNRFANAWTPLMYKGGTGRTYALWLNGGGYLHLNSADATGQQQVDTPVGSIQLNTWYDYVGVIDRIGGTMTNYLNGTPVGTGAVRTTDTVSATNPLRIGWTQEVNAIYSPFNGQMARVALWNRAMSAAEVVTEMNKLSQPLLDPKPGLVGYWEFEEGSGADTFDWSTAGNHGSLKNMDASNWVFSGAPESVSGSPMPAQTYPKVGIYPARLVVQSEFGKWSSAATARVTVIDGKIEGFVRAADLRTPVKGVRLTLSSSHVDTTVLANIAASDTPDLLNTNADGSLYTDTDDNGFYRFEHIPLGSYRIAASKVDGTTVHEFEKAVQATELTLDAPNQLAIDYVDLSVYPVGGRVVYSIQKNGIDVLVDNVALTAQPVSSTSAIRALPSTRSLSATGTNYSFPLFAGKYLFLAELPQHEIRIKGSTPKYDANTGLVSIEEARTDIDFIDYTTRSLTVFVVDSGGFKFPGKEITISGNNGQAAGVSDASEGKFVVTVNPGLYTVTVPGSVADDDLDPDSEPEQDSVEVDLTGQDGVVTLTIPVPIVLSVSPAPKLFDITPEFQAQFPDLAANNPEGFMFYYPPEPRTHTYTITATANGNPVADFNLFVVDNVGETTSAPAAEQAFVVQGTDSEYVMTAGLPAMDRTVDPPIAVPKTVTFRATKEKYQDSALVAERVTVLGDVPEGSASRIVSVPIVNYLVLHDPPGDGSYAYIDDTLTAKGIVSGMTAKIGGTDVPVYPSPWSDERTISGVNFEKAPNSDTTSQDLGSRGLLGTRSTTPASGAFTIASFIELASGVVVASTAGFGFVIQLVKLPILAASIESGTGIVGSTGIVQYEISPSRHLETSSGDTLTDLVGPGKGDLYFGEGWTLGLQTKYRLGIKLVNGQWEPDTAQIETYDILERTNQYVYTIRDIVNLIADLDKNIAQATDQAEKDKLTTARNTWEGLLNKNIAYLWHLNLKSETPKPFEQFRQDQGLPDRSETLIFSAGPAFEYSRRIYEGQLASFSTSMSASTSGTLGTETEIDAGFELFGSGVQVRGKFEAGYGIDTSQELSGSYESGVETEQTIGFVLQDDDIGDNITAHVYTDPVWGTPLFFQDPGSITSDPWETGTNKAIDLDMTLVEQPTNAGPFDYHEGAHYKLQIQYAGLRELETNWVDFVIYDLWTDNPEQMAVRFNGQAGPYNFSLAKSAPVVTFEVSLYPPASDLDNNDEKEYSVVIECDETADAYQINRVINLKPKFADLRAPRAVITSPYEGQRISPVLFAPPSVPPSQGGSTGGFKIGVVSEDSDLQKIQLQIRSKQPDGVWEPWRDLTGMAWEDAGANANVAVFDRLEQRPIRREFTFGWTDEEIRALGVAEYQLRAVATDKATKPNFDLDAPVVSFLVDDSPPSVLTSLPDYQARERDRIYRGELSVVFTDDMKPDDFSDRSFAVGDLLDNNAKVAGYVTYHPALRKAVFVPIVPFKPNGFYRVEVKTDTTGADNTVDRGVRDLAGNPLDNAFSWTFRTTDAPFEEQWSIALSVTDGTATDANNIAAVAYGALDGEDEQDAQAVPALANQLRLSFLDAAKMEYERDVRPADGRLEHHWFFVVGNAASGATVNLRWRPSVKLIQTTRQYQTLRLVEFNASGAVTNTVPLDPTLATLDPITGQPIEVDLYTYTNPAGETARTFRLDVMKVNLVATTFTNGSSGWRFFSAPITPQRADAFVNFGDDIDPFKMYQYDTKLGGYLIYPLDIGQVALQTGHGYFTRLSTDAEVDVGGASNLTNVTLSLPDIGWHAIGNPFTLPVNVAELQIGGKSFAQAVTDGEVEATLYRWQTAKNNNNDKDTYEAVDSTEQLVPWEGYWLKTKVADLALVIPVPAGVANAPNVLPPSFNPPAAPPVVVQEPGAFSLRLALTSAFASDVTTTLGTRANAQEGWDMLDSSEPPTLGQTVAAYFDHSEWGANSGQYNTDYQSPLQMGESRIWGLTVSNDQPKSAMTLSWEQAVGQIPQDTMLHFRLRSEGKPLIGSQPCVADEPTLRGGETEWRDMREVESVELVTESQFTKIPFEIRAERFVLSPIAELSVVAGEKQVKLSWKADNNPFIAGYTITKRAIDTSAVSDAPEAPMAIILKPGLSEYTDTNVEEEATYSYQVTVRFQSSAELASELFNVTVLAVIKETVLMQNYPNPFNPETWIPYELEKDADVSVEIYNPTGHLVRSIDLGFQTRGRYISRQKAAYWDGRNNFGEKVASGVYFYMLKAGDYSKIKKMVILK